MLDEERLRYVGSVVLGLNDALKVISLYRISLKIREGVVRVKFPWEHTASR